MSSILIFFKSGAKREFPHVGRAGGSYSKSLKLDGGFAIVTDEWGKRFAFPAQDILEIREEPERW